MNYIDYKQEDSIAILTICRPNEFNALNTCVLEEINAIIDGIDCDSVRCLLITGSGTKSFAAGADIAEMVDMSKEKARAFSRFGNRVFSKIESLRIPTIAVIRGYALGGGCELAMACDIRLASDTAVFGQPETSLGIIPGFGGTQRLPRIVGVSKAKEIIFSGSQIKADEALQIGLADRVFPDHQIIVQAKIIANRIAENAPIAVKCAKYAINAGTGLNMTDALSVESAAFSETFETEDQREGMSAFLEKRTHRSYQNK